MARRDYSHFTATCDRGINQQVENADPRRECADARNVWAPNGRVEQRPGYVGINASFSNSSFFPATKRLISEISGVFTNDTAGVLNLASLAVNDRWYIGFSIEAGEAIGNIVGFRLNLSASNVNATRFKAEYWNGIAWRYIPVTETDTSSFSDAAFGAPITIHLGSTLADLDSMFAFATPRDWATTTVNSLTLYFLRFQILESALDASVTTSNINNMMSVSNATGNSSSIKGLFAPQFHSHTRYITLWTRILSGVPSMRISSSNSLRTKEDFLLFSRAASEDEPASIAVVSEFNESYIAYNNIVTVHRAFPTSSDSIVATVDDRDSVIGPGAAFDRTLFQQDASFPQAKYITFFNNRLWAANLLGKPNSVKWTGKSPYYRVWPTLSEEPLVEDDNSPITGIAGYQESLVVFKEDSVWTMREQGVNGFNLTEYLPVRKVPGVGCVSHSSIQTVEGLLYHLAEDGVYAFDGTPNIQKLSENIQDTIDSITPGRRPFATSVHWRSKSLYLLAVSLDGSDANNHVLVYDYKNEAWWIWDNIEAQHWMRDQGSDDEEIIYFGDASGRIFQLGVGRLDNGAAISAYYTTHRLGFEEGETKVVREVRVFGDSQFTSATVDIFTNDAPSATQTATIDFSDPVETVNSRPLVRRTRRADFRTVGEWFQVKVSNSTKNTELRSGMLRVGYRRVANR